MREMLGVLFFVSLVCLTVNSQENPSGVSIDCGIPEGSNYTDAITGINYTSDASFVSTGVSSSIPALYQTNFLERQFLNLRSFPQGDRNCYTLKPPQGKGHKYLIKASFLYANYDNLNKLPRFDLYLGLNFWEQVIFTNESIPVKLELVHVPTSDYINVCLVKTTLSYPFISAIELRPLLNSSIYPTQSGSLDLYFRAYFTTQPAPLLRYKDDVYDREWAPFQLGDSVTLLAASAIRNNEYQLPLIALSTPNTPLNTSSLHFSFTPISVTDKFYVFFHFAEVMKLPANQSRKFDIYINGHRLNTQGPIVPAYLSATTVYSTSPETVSPIYSVSINQTLDSTLPPIINAVEIYNVREVLQSETDEDDVNAMRDIKSTYGLIRNWQGDPCLPIDFVWDGVSCRNNSLNPPTIISLNLSSSGLTGGIALSISNLSNIEELDLSNNSLTGGVPKFLTQLTSLKVLNLNGNKLTGFVPAQLLEKSRNGLLSMSIDPSNNSDPCQFSRCKRKKRSVVVPILASVIGAVLVIMAILGILWMVRFRRRNQLGSKSLSRKDSLARHEEETDVNE